MSLNVSWSKIKRRNCISNDVKSDVECLSIIIYELSLLLFVRKIIDSVTRG